MKIVCFDTQVMIWGFQEKARTSQQDMIRRAKQLILELEETKTTVLIPAIVVAELLIGFAPVDRENAYRMLMKNFRIASFDTKSAFHFAKLWDNRWHTPEVQELLNQDKNRQMLKADSMIVATAIAHNAESIYSTDKGIRAFGEGYIPILEVPPLKPFQPTLLE